jgi:hypothetical protein
MCFIRHIKGLYPVTALDWGVIPARVSKTVEMMEWCTAQNYEKCGTQNYDHVFTGFYRRRNFRKVRYKMK